MKLHAIFLRAECVLPDGLHLAQEQFCKTWMSIEDTTSAVLDERSEVRAGTLCGLRKPVLTPVLAGWQDPLSIRRSLVL